MTPPDDVPSYLGWIVDEEDKSIGTCFQVGPAVLVTALHVLIDAGADRKGARVRVGTQSMSRPLAATVHAIDKLHDLAVLVSSRPLGSSVQLRRSGSVRVGTRLQITGIAEFPNNPPFRISSTAATWHGPAQRRDNVRLGVINAPNLTRGMSGAPVRQGRGRKTVGVVLARYRVAGNDRYLEHAVWVARVEDLAPLLAGTVAEQTARALSPFRVAFQITTIVAIGLMCAGTPAVQGKPQAAGDISLARQGTPTLLFTPLSGGLDMCSHSNGGWAGRWHGIDRNQAWTGIDSFAATGSSYNGIEVFARRGDQMFFGWRSGDLHWHTLRQIDDSGRVRGRPALVEWGDGNDKTRAFIGLVPDLLRGVRVYIRDDYRGRFTFRWADSAVKAPGLGRVDAVAATVLDAGEVLVIVQKGADLFRIEGRPVIGVPGLTIRWGTPLAVLDEQGKPVRASGSPAAVLTDTIGERTAVVVVPTDEHAVFMTATKTPRWASEQVPLYGAIDSLTVLDGENSAGRVFIVVGRRGRELVVSIRSPDRKWTKETALRCHHNEHLVPVDE
jgi:hypothetical protein